MKNFLELLNKNILFAEIPENELASVLDCLGPAQKSYPKDSHIIMETDSVKSIGIVLSGSLHIIKEDYWGNRSILTEISPGGLFGETYACLKNQPSEISAVSNTSCEILFLDIDRILSSSSHSCSFHGTIVKNLLMVMARKNFMLTRKMAHTSKRTTREKLLSYLSAQAISTNSNSFQIPYNRQELADYLSVDRSAMSSEMSKLAHEGIIEYKKNKFKLLSY